MTVPNLRRSWARSLFLAAFLLYLAPQAVAAIVTGANQPRRAFDGSGGYTYTRILEGLTGAGAIDTLLTDGSGHLVVSTTGTGAVSGTVTANQGTAGASPWATSANAAATTSATLLSAVTATGAGTALSTDGMGSVGLTVAITGTATVTWQGTEDGSTWNSISAMGSGTPPLSQTATASGTYLVNVAGLKQIRPNITSYSSGSVTVTAHASPTGHPPRSIALAQQQAVSDANNSSTATLGNGGVFTGAATDALNYAGLVVNFFADQATASNGLKIQQSSDGTNWDLTDQYTVAASTFKSLAFGRVARYVRVTVTNGATPQGAMRLQTLLTPVASGLPRVLDSVSATGAMFAALTDKSGTGISSSSDGSDSLGATLQGINAASFGVGFNGSTWDRWRNNTDLSLLASAARTATTTSADQVNYNGRGVVCVINVSAASGTGGLTISLQGKDSISGNYYSLLSTTAIIATGTTTLTLYPGATVAANAAASFPLPRTWRVSVAVGDASSYTYSVSGVTVN